MTMTRDFHAPQMNRKYDGPKPLRKSGTVWTVVATIIVGLIMPFLDKIGLHIPRESLVAVVAAILAFFLRRAIHDAEANIASAFRKEENGDSVRNLGNNDGSS
jgi:hypothetical protein